jgi:hypothetical protein
LPFEEVLLLPEVFLSISVSGVETLKEKSVSPTRSFTWSINLAKSSVTRLEATCRTAVEEIISVMVLWVLGKGIRTVC